MLHTQKLVKEIHLQTLLNIPVNNLKDFGYPSISSLKKLTQSKIHAASSIRAISMWNVLYKYIRQTLVGRKNGLG
jgi:hypothetical protein